MSDVNCGFREVNAIQLYSCWLCCKQRLELVKQFSTGDIDDVGHDDQTNQKQL